MNFEKGLSEKMIELIDQHSAEQHQKQVATNIVIEQPIIPKGSKFSYFTRWLPTPGNVLFTLLVVGFLVMTQRVWAIPNLTSAPGASATTINYQGRLEDSSGNPLNGQQDLKFAIYDRDTGGEPIWGPETHDNTPVQDGLFNVGLGSKKSGGIPPSIWNGDRYLQTTVNNETLLPRELIRSVPIAGMALTVPDKSVTRSKVDFAVPELYRPPLSGGECHDLIANLQDEGFSHCMYASSPGSGLKIWHSTTNCSGTGTEEPSLWQKDGIWSVRTRPNKPVYIKGRYWDQMPYLVCTRNP